MIKKVLIAEDHESASISVQKTLEELGINELDYVHYCDDALLKIQKAVQNGESYDLLITDLYFEQDHRRQKIPGGEALIAAAREHQPDLKVLVFSAENRALIIEQLFEKQEIDGYVRKARNDAKELKLAINSIAGNGRYVPASITQLLRQKNVHEFSEFDVIIVSFLAKGIRQKDIPEYLKKNQIKPTGLSSVEKRLSHLKDSLNFSTNEQLIAYCKDMGIV